MNSVFNDFFYPKTICVIGASSKPKSLGYELTKSIKKYGYTGKLLLVNPKSEEVLGFKCFPDIPSIIEKIDLGIIMAPKPFVEESISQLIAKGTRAIILITAGFKETGKEGEIAEKQILELIRKSGARMVGPNCMGIINTLASIKMNATFVAEEPQNGKMAFCSQSGAIGAAVLNSLRETDIKFSHFISVGNKADVSENDLLEYWQADDQVSVMTYYLESFEEGGSFIQKFIDGKITKPVIILKGGRTSSGIKAASSHTGALGSSDKVVDAVLQQFGILRADDLNDLFNTAKGFENFPLPNGNKIAVVTNAGGPAILTVDTLEKNRLSLAKLNPSTKNKLREIVPPQGSVNNPVDLLPGGTAEQFKQVNEILLNDKNVDAVISVFVEPVMVPALRVIESINSIESEKPIFQVVMPLPEFWEQYRKESKSKRSLFRKPEDPSVVISNLLKFRNKPDHRNRLRKNQQTKINIDLKKSGGKFLYQEDVIKISKKYNLPIIPTQISKYEEIKKAKLKYPVVLKAVGEKIIHKSDLKGVVLNIENKNELIEQAEKMKTIFKKQKLEIKSFLLQPYIHTKFELLVGGFRDPSFGPMVMFGSGGKYVEYFDDTIIRSAYLNDKDIEEMINGTKVGKIIQGVRGEKSTDLAKVKSVIKSAAQMMLDNEEINECDINPLVVTEDNNI
ncbi:MAG TPA: acetate--CoA ligase family protein, partial [Ignavibacteriaceae bacterium]|nr:acetate--CoA ligase family protein [Ignavibacteriaceae bacterium]